MAASGAERLKELLLQYPDDDFSLHPPKRRPGYSSGSLQWDAARKAERVLHAKSAASRELILSALQQNYLFENLSATQLGETVDCMEEHRVAAGIVIITKGEEGDYFYVIERGEVEVARPENPVPRRLGPGASFGELALLLNQPRSATVTAITPVELWRIDRLSFRQMLMAHAVEKSDRYAHFLQRLPLFQRVDKPTLLRTVDALQPRVFGRGNFVVRQGEQGDSFYILEEGEAEVLLDSEDGQASPRTVRKLSPGDYFGEMSLLRRCPRTASVRVVSETARCLELDREAFDRLLEPAEDVLAERMRIYL